MSFWSTSDNSTIDGSGKFAVGGGEPIPANTVLKVMATGAKWDEYQGDRFIAVEWDVIEGDHKNRKVFQKIRVNEATPARRDRAIKMLAAIDANCGGTLRALGREPSDIELAQGLLHKPMYIKVDIWEFEGKKGNWVQAVSGGGTANPAQAVTPPPAATPAVPAGGWNIDEDIPFAPVSSKLY